jgi:hypothetical protein
MELFRQCGISCFRLDFVTVPTIWYRLFFDQILELFQQCESIVCRLGLGTGPTVWISYFSVKFWNCSDSVDLLFLVRFWNCSNCVIALAFQFRTRYPWLQVIIPVKILNISSEMFDGKGLTDTLTMRYPCLGK